jgi:hypothetical protein
LIRPNETLLEKTVNETYMAQPFAFEKSLTVVNGANFLKLQELKRLNGDKPY